MSKCCEKCFAKGVNLDLNVCLDGSCECHRPKECCKMLNKYQCSQSTDGCDCQCHNVSTPRPDSSSLPPQDLMRKPCERCIDRTAYFNKVVCKQWECSCECHTGMTEADINRGFFVGGEKLEIKPQDPGLSGYVGELAEEGIVYLESKNQDPQPSWERIKNKYSQSGWFDNIHDIKELDEDIRTHFISRQELREKVKGMRKSPDAPDDHLIDECNGYNSALEDVEDLI